MEELLNDWHRRAYAAQCTYYQLAERFRKLHYKLGICTVILTSAAGATMIRRSARLLLLLGGLAGCHGGGDAGVDLGCACEADLGPAAGECETDYLGLTFDSTRRCRSYHLCNSAAYDANNTLLHCGHAVGIDLCADEGP